MKRYDLDRLVKLTTLISRPVEQDTLFDVLLKECMLIGNCDGGTIYTIEGNKLYFRYIYTLSKGVAMNYKSGSETIPPVPMRSQYVCAYAAINKLRLNIPDVYVSHKFDFTGTRKYDEMNNYRTCSMLVVPMLVGHGDVMGVLQLINAKDSHGLWTPFTNEQEDRISAIGSVAALYLENLKLKGLLEDVLQKSIDEEIGIDEEKKKEISKEATKSIEDSGPISMDFPILGNTEKKEEKNSGNGGGFWTFKI